MTFDIDPRARDDDWTPNRSLLLHFGHREYVLFIGWKIGSNFGLVGSMLMVFLIAVLHEAVLALRLFLDREILLNTIDKSAVN